MINPLVSSIKEMPKTIINDLVSKIKKLADKYATTLLDIQSEIKATENEFSGMIDDLEGSEFDMKGLKKLQSLLKGE